MFAMIDFNFIFGRYFNIENKSGFSYKIWNLFRDEVILYLIIRMPI